MRILAQTWRFTATVFAAGLLLVPAGTAAMATSSHPASEPTAASAANDGQGPQFYSGVAVDVSGPVDGDVYASGQSVTISGDVTGDVIAAGQSITITGTVDGNVRLAGGTVLISGDVSRSGTVFAGTVNVTDTGTIGTDLVSAAGDIFASPVDGTNNQDPLRPRLLDNDELSAFQGYIRGGGGVRRSARSDRCDARGALVRRSHRRQRPFSQPPRAADSHDAGREPHASVNRDVADRMGAF